MSSQDAAEVQGTRFTELRSYGGIRELLVLDQHDQDVGLSQCIFQRNQDELLVDLDVGFYRDEIVPCTEQ